MTWQVISFETVKYVRRGLSVQLWCSYHSNTRTLWGTYIYIHTNKLSSLQKPEGTFKGVVFSLFFKQWVFFKDFFIYLFLERKEGREFEKERKIYVWLPLVCPLLGTWPATQACTPTGNQTGDLLVHRPALNPLNHTIWGKGVIFSNTFIVFTHVIRQVERR